MTEHVHEWITDDWGYEGYHFKCSICDRNLERGPDWIARRLNATERLSAERAKYLEVWGEDRKDIAAYIAALEGE